MRAMWVILLIGLTSGSMPDEARAGAGKTGDPLTEAIAFADRSRAGNDYAYTRSLRLVAVGERIDRVERFDPTQPDGARWHLLEIEGREPSADDLADYDGEDFGGRAFRLYSDVIGDLDPDEAELVDLTPERAIYRLKQTKAAFLDEDQQEFAEYLDSRLIVDRRGPVPYVSELEIVAPEPFRPSMAARIERFEARFRYAPHPETEEILPTGILVDIAVTALFVVSVEARTEIGFRDFVPVSEAVN